MEDELSYLWYITYNKASPRLEDGACEPFVAEKSWESRDFKLLASSGKAKYVHEHDGRMLLLLFLFPLARVDAFPLVEVSTESSLRVSLSVSRRGVKSFYISQPRMVRIFSWTPFGCARGASRTLPPLGERILKRDFRARALA